MMDNATPQKHDALDTELKQEMVTHVTLRKYEVIEILQALEGLKKRLQPLLEHKIK